MSGTVWVAERVAIYGQGVVAVLTSREAAERFAATVRPDNDGHHAWCFTELRLDAVPDTLPPYADPDDRYDDDDWCTRLTAPEHVDTRGSTYNAKDRDRWIPLAIEGS